MKMRRLVTLSMFVSLLLFGVWQPTLADGNAGNRAIKKIIHPDDSQVLVVADKRVWLNPDSCDKSYQLVLDAGKLSSDAVYREMLAMLLAAQVSGRRVEVRANGCLGVGGFTFPVISQVTFL